MSASLVGSEMCIRDRSTPVGARGKLYACWLVDGLLKGPGGFSVTAVGPTAGWPRGFCGVDS
eukprot:12182412-Alexandrium_andersonii.AAC.1